MAKGTSFRYRDTQTGKFVPRSTWNRSKAQGGKRYKREKIEAHPEGEYQINVKYKPNQASKVEVQIAAEGPPGQSKSQVIAAIEYRIREGEDKEGWVTHVAEWRKAGKTYAGDDEEVTWRGLGFIFPQATKNLR